jgi:preprotein translocase subunit SecA
MFLNLASKIFGSSNERALKSLRRHIEPINALEPKFEAMSDSELRSQTDLFRQRLSNGETLDDLLIEAFAVVREAAKRTLKQRHYDVQLIGGLTLHRGKIAEMKTGEGKTLVSTLAVYLNALPGKGVHVVTVNDYLAKRDAEWMGQIYRFLGMSVGCILGNIPDIERRLAYGCDITYGTNNEFGFDYLRDNMKYSLSQMVQRPFHFAIIDEVDSILVDEARTPLIISGPSDMSTDLYARVDRIIPALTPAHYETDMKNLSASLTEEGQHFVEELLKSEGVLKEGGLYDVQNIALVHHVNQALRAHKLYFHDVDYILKDDKVILIDQFTGRMMEGRRLSEGLHQAIEAKEKVKIQSENQTLASITFQNYFRLYPKLAGMTGTAMTEAAEFHEIYKLGVVEIPTNVPVARIDSNDKIYKSMREKHDAIVNLIRDCQVRGQPVLVGTISIEKSEKLSERLKKEKITHNVLNARYHEQEAYIIAQAGRPGAVTIATNMAGRGTDIQLGGNADMLIQQEVPDDLPEDQKTAMIAQIRMGVERDRAIARDAGGLYVVGTERHESRRIDNQLRGRSGRQGDPGASIFFLSVEDDLMRIFAGERLESLLANQHIGLQEGEALEHPLISKLLERAQAKVESMHFETRKNLLKFDDVMNDQRKIIYDQRREIMETDNLEDYARDMRHTVIEDMVHTAIPKGSYAEQWNMTGLHAETMRILGLDLPVADWAKEEGIAEEEMVNRIIAASDNKIAQKIGNVGPNVWKYMEKSIVLQGLDQSWKEHLLGLDHLRQGINLRAFGQRDPLNEYKAEAFAMFEFMLGAMRENITTTLSLVDGKADPSMLTPRQQKMEETRQDPALMGIGVMQTSAAGNPESAPPPSRPRAVPQRKRVFNKDDPSTWGVVSRNAPCPCGSGKKYKQCHGAVNQNG